MLRRFRQFTTLPGYERRMLARATLLVATVRTGLWLLPFRVVSKLTSRQRAVSSDLANISARRLSWAVQTAARRIPRANCLVQALALQALLIRAGKPARLHIGVAKDSLRRLEAHAWLEYQGEILIGDDGVLGRFRSILTLDRSARGTLQPE
jgi:hypothetical protein